MKEDKHLSQDNSNLVSKGSCFCWKILLITVMKQIFEKLPEINESIFSVLHINICLPIQMHFLYTHILSKDTI